MHGALDIETNSLILTVDTEGLQELVDALKDGVPRTIPLQSPPDRPATRAVRALSLDPGEDGLVIKIENNMATLIGSESAWAQLARELELFREYNDLTEPGMHTHFEPGASLTAGSAPVLASDSCELIIAGPVPED